MKNPCICILIVAPPSAETARNATPPPHTHPPHPSCLSAAPRVSSPHAQRSAWLAQALASHRGSMCFSLFHRAIFTEEAFRRPPGRGGRRDHALISGRGPLTEWARPGPHPWHEEGRFVEWTVAHALLLEGACTKRENCNCGTPCEASARQPRQAPTQSPHTSVTRSHLTRLDR